MSNSIWKTGNPTYRNDNFDEIIVREYKRWATDGVFYLVDDYTELPNRWAYLLDIIAQADKAERLQEIALTAIKEIAEECGCLMAALKSTGFESVVETFDKNIRKKLKQIDHIADTNKGQKK